MIMNINYNTAAVNDKFQAHGVNSNDTILDTPTYITSKWATLLYRMKKRSESSKLSTSENKVINPIPLLSKIVRRSILRDRKLQDLIHAYLQNQLNGDTQIMFLGCRLNNKGFDIIEPFGAIMLMELMVPILLSSDDLLDVDWLATNINTLRESGFSFDHSIGTDPALPENVVFKIPDYGSLDTDNMVPFGFFQFRAETVADLLGMNESDLMQPGVIDILATSPFSLQYIWFRLMYLRQLRYFSTSIRGTLRNLKIAPHSVSVINQIPLNHLYNSRWFTTESLLIFTKLGGKITLTTKISNLGSKSVEELLLNSWFPRDLLKNLQSEAGTDKRTGQTIALANIISMLAALDDQGTNETIDLLLRQYRRKLSDPDLYFSHIVPSQKIYLNWITNTSNSQRFGGDNVTGGELYMKTMALGIVEKFGLFNVVLLRGSKDDSGQESSYSGVGTDKRAVISGAINPSLFRLAGLTEYSLPTRRSYVALFPRYNYSRVSTITKEYRNYGYAQENYPADISLNTPLSRDNALVRGFTF